MDKSGFKFTAEQVRGFLGLNNDYVDSSSSSSSCDDSQNESNLDFSSLTQTDSNESGNETLIPPSPKRIRTVTKICKHGQNQNHVFTNTCTQVNTTGEKVEHGNVEEKTCANDKSPQKLHIAQPSYIPKLETDVPLKSNHDEQNMFFNVELGLEPVFTIQLDIPAPDSDTCTITNAINIAPPTFNICLPHVQEAVYSEQEMITLPISVPQTEFTNHPAETALSPPHQIKFLPEYHPDNEVSENEDVNQYYEVET